MAKVEVKCPTCGDRKVYKYGKSKTGEQRYLCHNKACHTKTFRLEYRYEGSKPGIDKKIIDMATNGSGIRDTSRVLKITTDKVMSTLKKLISPINYQYINEHSNIEQIKCHIVPYHKIYEAELDEMWSFVRSKSNQRWLWLALDHSNGKIIAYAFGKCKDKVFSQIQTLLAPFKISIFYTDNWGSYERLIPYDNHVIGKKYTQTIEQKNLTLRTRVKRLCRKTICFSKSEVMHDIVIGLAINVIDFGWVFSVFNSCST